jgi:hypothetical protein
MTKMMTYRCKAECCDDIQRVITAFAAVKNWNFQSQMKYEKLLMEMKKAMDFQWTANRNPRTELEWTFTLTLSLDEIKKLIAGIEDIDLIRESIELLGDFTGKEDTITYSIIVLNEEGKKNAEDQHISHSIPQELLAADTNVAIPDASPEKKRQSERVKKSNTQKSNKASRDNKKKKNQKKKK